jgi:hypothetical protein
MPLPPPIWPRAEIHVDLPDAPAVIVLPKLSDAPPHSSSDPNRYGAHTANMGSVLISDTCGFTLTPCDGGVFLQWYAEIPTFGWVWLGAPMRVDN